MPRPSSKARAAPSNRPSPRCATVAFPARRRFSNNGRNAISGSARPTTSSSSPCPKVTASCRPISTRGAPLGPLAKADATQLKPNSGIRAIIAAALVQFQLSDPDPAKKQDALTAIARDPSETHLAPLRASIETETDPDDPRPEATAGTPSDPALRHRRGRPHRRHRKLRLRRGRRSACGAQPAARHRAQGQPRPDPRRRKHRPRPDPGHVPTCPSPRRRPCSSSIGALQPVLTPAERRAALIANIDGDAVGGIPVAELEHRSQPHRRLRGARGCGRRAARRDRCRGHGRARRPQLLRNLCRTVASRRRCRRRRPAGDRAEACAEPGGRPRARRAVAGLDLLPCRHRPCHHLRRDARHQHGAWRIHHDGRLYRLRRAAVDHQLHGLDPRGPAAGLLPSPSRRAWRWSGW